MLKKFILIAFIFSCESCFSQYADFIFRDAAFIDDFMAKKVNFDSIILKDEALLKELKVKSVYYKDRKGRIDEIIKYKNGKIVELSTFTTNEVVPTWNFFYDYYPNGLIKEMEESMFGKYPELHKFNINNEKYETIELFGSNSRLKNKFVFEYSKYPNDELFTKVKQYYWSGKIYDSEYSIIYNNDNKITEINYKNLSDSNKMETLIYRFSSDSIFIYKKEYSEAYILKDNRIHTYLYYDEGVFSSKSTYYYKNNNLVDYVLYEEKGKKPFKKEYYYSFE